MLIALILLAALAGAWFTYRHLEPKAPGAWVPLACRAVAWGAVGLLLADPGFTSRAPGGRPLVLLDASLSLRADSGAWRRATDTARALGRVRWFGDARPWTDSVDARGRSDPASALEAAAAVGRRVVVVTDGELDDFEGSAPDLRAGAGFLVLPRPTRRDFLVDEVSGPARVTVGDSLRLSAIVRLLGSQAPDTAVVTLELGSRVLARTRVVLAPGAAVVVELAASTRGLPAGTAFFAARVAGPGDEEPRDDARLVAVTMSPTPGIVLLARPGDWDARFLYRTLREVAELPVKGYVSVVPGSWRDMERLEPVPGPVVQAAAHGADLLVIRGEAGVGIEARREASTWRWPDASGGAGEWYVTAAPGSPVGMAFAGIPAESLPPVTGASGLEVGPDDWVGASAQVGRRGAPRPVWIGRQAGARREVVVGADGFWRWGFRGGLSGDAYRVLVASSVAWLLATPEGSAALARPLRTVVEHGMPLVFARTADSLALLPITLTGAAGDRTDTLRFGGDGTAGLYLPPGTYHYRLAAGRAGAGVVAVDGWSREWAVRPPVVASRAGAAAATGTRHTARDVPWLYVLALAALAGEWLARRRLGLR